MTASGLVSDDLQPGPTPSQPRPVTGIALAGLLLSVIGIALVVLAAGRLRDYNHGGIISTIVGAVLVVVSLYPLWPSFRSFAAGRERAALLRDDQLVLARRASAAGREEAQIAMGYAAAAIVVAALLLMDPRVLDQHLGCPGRPGPGARGRPAPRDHEDAAGEGRSATAAHRPRLLRRLPRDPGDRHHPADRVRHPTGLPGDARVVTGLARHRGTDDDLLGLRRRGLPRRARLDPPEPERRRSLPGAELHANAKDRARAAGGTPRHPATAERLHQPAEGHRTAVHSSHRRGRADRRPVAEQAVQPLPRHAFFIIITLPQARFVDYLIDRDAARRAGQ